MLSGVCRAGLDQKGRINLSSRLEGLSPGSELTLTVSHRDKCLLLYPRDDWQKLADALMSDDRDPDPADEPARFFLLGHAHAVTLDAARRILLPPEHREIAGIDPEHQRKVVLLGVGRKLQIWEASIYRVECEEQRLLSRTLGAQESHQGKSPPAWAKLL